MMSFSPSSTSLPVPMRRKFTSRALPYTRLVDEPTNTSPFAPTYSGAEDVEMARVTVVALLHVLAFSPWIFSLRPTVRSFVLFSSLMIATPKPVEVVQSMPNFVVVINSVSDDHTPPVDSALE